MRIFFFICHDCCLDTIQCLKLQVSRCACLHKHQMVVAHENSLFYNNQTPPRISKDLALTGAAAMRYFRRQRWPYVINAWWHIDSSIKVNLCDHNDVNLEAHRCNSSLLLPHAKKFWARFKARAFLWGVCFFPPHLRVFQFPPQYIYPLFNKEKSHWD